MKTGSERNRIYLSPPHMAGNEQKYIREAFETNWIAPLGPNVDAFENSLAEYCGIRYVAALSSGTAAIHLALILLGIMPGDEVIVSTFTFSASVNPIVYLGATPVFVDSEPGTWNMDPDLLEKAIVERIKEGERGRSSFAEASEDQGGGEWVKKPKAIIVVHLYGMPANMDRIMEIANKYEIPVIEDAAEALGSKYKGRQVGTFGKMGVLSFNGNKIITTSGGGALISDEKELIDKARFLATQARDKAPHYQHSRIGYNYRMSNVLAGIGRGQMEVLEERVLKRRSNYEFYHSRLKEFSGLSFLQEPGKEYYSNRWLTTILIDKAKSGSSREEIQNDLEKENIETRPLWKPMHLQPVFSAYPSYLSGVSEELFSGGLCLPSGSNLSEEDLQRIITTLSESVIH
jgi:dTDP-4-amino-4,6-dideoxygalactose transaminase